MHSAIKVRSGTRQSARGFTLIEIMMVVTIIALMLTIAVPSMGEFVADQRVRTITSDVVSEIALARAKAIESSRRVYMEKLVAGGFWNDGWRLYVDVDDSGTYNAGDIELKHFDGFKTTSSMYMCTRPAAFSLNPNQLIFRPDGRIVRNAATLPTDGIYIVDVLNDTDPTNDKVRAVLFGLSGRPSVQKMNASATNAPPLPCIKN